MAERSRSARNRASKPLSALISLRLRQRTEQQESAQRWPITRHSHPPAAPPGREHVEWRVHKQQGRAGRVSHRRQTWGRSTNSPCSLPSIHCRQEVIKLNSSAYVEFGRAVPASTYASSEKSASANDGFSELVNRSAPTPQASGGDQTSSKLPESPPGVGMAYETPAKRPTTHSNHTFWCVCFVCVCV